MKFVDEVTITVQSGNGGRGSVSFRREKYIPRGGPDGGDGGKGGDVIFETNTARRTLFQFRFKREFRAPNGGYGQGQNKSGKSGTDLILQIPPGTLVFNAETDELIKDFKDSGESFVVARGGRGGQGNARFKSATHRTPRFAQPGEPGQQFHLRLELKLLADVGLIGLPNAGKSTLLAAVSGARPKIADYPFTTLTPNLGVVQTRWGEPFVMADIPGLIEGAHEGHGLGTRFLRHIERTRILVHMIDAAAIDPGDPLAALRTVNRELAAYAAALACKPQIVVLNKIDLPDTGSRIAAFRDAVDDPDAVLAVSAARGSGLDRLISSILARLEAPRDPEPGPMDTSAFE